MPARGVVDFAELLLRTYELLTRNEILREQLPNRFRHILVDEFQDTNRLQYRWLKLLAGPKNVVFASAMTTSPFTGFAARTSGNMAEFERDFRVENVIRSSRTTLARALLAAANALIAHNKKAPRQEPVDLAGARRAGAHLRGAERRVRGELAR